MIPTQSLPTHLTFRSSGGEFKAAAPTPLSTRIRCGSTSALIILKVEVGFVEGRDYGPANPSVFKERGSNCLLCPMCGRLPVGEAFLHDCRLVGAAMCSACLCGSHDRWP